MHFSRFPVREIWLRAYAIGQFETAPILAATGIRGCGRLFRELG